MFKRLVNAKYFKLIQCRYNLILLEIAEMRHFLFKKKTFLYRRDRDFFEIFSILCEQVQGFGNGSKLIGDLSHRGH